MFGFQSEWTKKKKKVSWSLAKSQVSFFSFPSVQVWQQQHGQHTSDVLVTIFLHFSDFPFCCGDASSSFVAEERSIYMTNLVLEWLQSIGGLKGLHLITIPSPLSVLKISCCFCCWKRWEESMTKRPSWFTMLWTTRTDSTREQQSEPFPNSHSLPLNSFFCLSFQFQLSCERCCCSIEDEHSHPNCGWK